MADSERRDPIDWEGIERSPDFQALVAGRRRFVAMAGGGTVGLTVAYVLAVWPGPDSEGSPVPLANPALFSFPLGFLSCWLGTVLSREARAERSYQELHVRAETGVGAVYTPHQRRASSVKASAAASILAASAHSSVW